MARPRAGPRSPTLAHVRTLLCQGTVRPPGRTIAPSGQTSRPGPPGELRYFFAVQRWFPTPTPAAGDIVRPSSKLSSAKSREAMRKPWTWEVALGLAYLIGEVAA
jgi:hypothetical protein